MPFYRNNKEIVLPITIKVAVLTWRKNIVNGNSLFKDIGNFFKESDDKSIKKSVGSVKDQLNVLSKAQDGEIGRRQV